MKKLLLSAFLITFCAGFAKAGPFDAFNHVLNLIAYNSGGSKDGERLAQRYLDVLAKDVGQAISGGSYGVGGNLRISDLNLMLSLKVSYQDVATDNFIVRTSGETSITYPIIHAEYAFAERYDAIARASYFNSSALFGGGLRYKILVSEDEIYIPTLSVQSVYTHIFYSDGELGKFNAWNLKTGTTAFFGLIPYIQPYVFLTYDFMGLNPGSSYYSHLSARAQGFGYGAGANIKMDMLNISVSVSMYDNLPNISFGVFVGI
ncbi:MAG: hypothetical protein FWG57_07985 [Endomicrobia bacterium]|nr:hypothetical protein [Bacillota bacterium]MCL1972907.1 hypothetical protein [Endomicrobiia bacterium]